MSEANNKLLRAEKEASDWFVLLSRRSVSADALSEFQVWRQDVDNRQAYQRVEALWAQTGTLDLKDTDVAASVSAALNRSEKATKWTRALPVGLVACVLAAVALTSIWFWNGRPATYVTDIGEQRLVALDDGSQLRLDTNSRVRVRFHGRERRVDLEQGQAFFSVAQDIRRPFRVHAGDTVVTALGTRFDVRRNADETVKVVLLEGSIDVRRSSTGQATKDRILTPGQQVIVGETVPEPHAADTEVETSWTTGRLLFRDKPLSTAIVEVNRYSRQQIVLEATAFASTSISGAFDVGDTQAFVAATTDLFPLVARQTGPHSIHLVDRNAGSQ
jgi:transmembrane sensor